MYARSNHKTSFFQGTHEGGAVLERLQFLVLPAEGEARNCLGAPKAFGTRMSERTASFCMNNIVG